MLIPILIRLQLWSFLVFPGTGFITGYILQWMFGLRGRPKYESLAVHVITTTLVSLLFFDTHQNISKQVFTSSSKRFGDGDPNDYHYKSIALYMGICYLFILGCIVGMMSEII